MNLPDEIAIGPLLEREGLPAEFEEMVYLLQKYRGYFLYIPYLLFVLFLYFCCLLAGRFKGFGWFGAAFLLSGLVFYIFLLLSRLLLISTFVPPSRSMMPLDREMFINAVTYTIARMSLFPLVFIVMGLLLLVAAAVLEKRLGGKVAAGGSAEVKDLAQRAAGVD